VVLSAAPVLAWPSSASAHPLGNFTVNVYSGLRVLPDRVEVDLVVDMAEIPAYQERGAAAEPAYAARACSEAAAGLEVVVDGRPAPVAVRASSVTFPPGLAGLDTLRLACRAAAETGTFSDPSTIRFRSRVHDDRVGWREITAVGDGVRVVASDVPATSASAALTAYPDDLLQSPLDQRRATIRVEPGSGEGVGRDGVAAPPAAATGARSDPLARRLAALVDRRDLGLGVGAVAVALSLALGAAHAFAPGHGKSIMAAYLVGQRGTCVQAAAIALTVTATHTAGVLVLGVALSLSGGLVPERVYPWLGLASGALICAVGLGLLARNRRSPARAGHHHGHTHGLAPAHHNHGHGHAHHAHADHAHARHDHHHAHGHGHGHGHGHAHHAHADHAHARHDHHAHAHTHDRHAHAHHDHHVSRRDLLTMGLAGGLVPTPSALLVLLGAIALGRAWFGVVLVVAYGLGMAATLMALGLLMARARAGLERRLAPRSRLAALAGALPVVTSSLIVLAGVMVAARAAAQL
jgi:ABC-type nickel/cobalt efflux system permease component RcnA